MGKEIGISMNECPGWHGTRSAFCTRPRIIIWDGDSDLGENHRNSSMADQPVLACKWNLKILGVQHMAVSHGRTDRVRLGMDKAWLDSGFHNTESFLQSEESLSFVQ